MGFEFGDYDAGEVARGVEALSYDTIRAEIPRLAANAARGMEKKELESKEKNCKLGAGMRG